MDRIVGLVLSVKKTLIRKQIVQWQNVDFRVKDEVYGADKDGLYMREIFNQDTGTAKFYPCQGHWNIRSVLLEKFDDYYWEIQRPSGSHVASFGKDLKIMEKMFLTIQDLHTHISPSSRSGSAFKKLTAEDFFALMDEDATRLLNNHETLSRANAEYEEAKRSGTLKKRQRFHDLTRLTARIERATYETMHAMMNDLKGGFGTIMALLELFITDAYKADQKRQRAVKREEKRAGRKKGSRGPPTPTVDSEEPPVDGEERTPAEAPADADTDIPLTEAEDDDTPTVIEFSDNYGRSSEHSDGLSSRDLDFIADFLELYCRYHTYRLKQIYMHKEDGPLEPQPLGKVRRVDHWQALYWQLSSQRARDREWVGKEAWNDRLIHVAESVQLAARIETFFGKNIPYFMTKGMEEVYKYEDLDFIRKQLTAAAVLYGFWPVEAALKVLEEKEEGKVEEEEEENWDSVSQREPNGASDVGDAEPADPPTE